MVRKKKNSVIKNKNNKKNNMLFFFFFNILIFFLNSSFRVSSALYLFLTSRQVRSVILTETLFNFSEDIAVIKKKKKGEISDGGESENEINKMNRD